MSYIRCLSNPEGLYIYLSTEGHIDIAHCLKPPFRSKEKNPTFPGMMVIPPKIFFEACHRWDHGPDQWVGPVKVGDLLVEERHIYEDDGTKVPSDWRPFRKGRKERPTSYRILFKYKSQYIMLWRVTWHYVVANVVDREMEEYRCRWCAGSPGRKA